jgi:hypothetical protein
VFERGDIDSLLQCFPQRLIIANSALSGGRLIYSAMISDGRSS